MEALRRLGWFLVWAPALASGPVLAKSEKSADDWVEQAKVEISADRLSMARKDLLAAITKTPDHAEAHFLLCGVASEEAERLFRGFATQEKVSAGLEDADETCGTAAKHNTDPRIVTSRLRAQIARRRWEAAATSFESLIAGSPDDGRLVGGYAAMLDRAGRTGEAAAALDRASTRGSEFDRAARFEYVWDRYDISSPEPLMPLIDRLRAEETDAHRIAVLDVLTHAMAERGSALLLEFLQLVESNALTQTELEKLWMSMTGPPVHGDDKPWLRDGYGSGKDVEFPRLISRTKLHYPAHAQSLHEEGRVDLLTRVQADGTVGPIWVMRSSGPSFAGEAIVAVRNWRYAPAKKSGQSVPFPWVVRINFGGKR